MQTINLDDSLVQNSSIQQIDDPSKINNLNEDSLEEETIRNITNNIVQVDYIEGEYFAKDKSGFAKRGVQGYNGGKAGKRIGGSSLLGGESRSDLNLTSAKPSRSELKDNTS